MSANSRQTRQSWTLSSAEITERVAAVIADADVCPGCGMAMPFTAPSNRHLVRTHAARCASLRAQVRADWTKASHAMRSAH
jgi:hypothetical protein